MSLHECVCRQLPLWFLLLFVGGVLYWGMFGLCFLLTWTTGVWWVFKVLFSLYNLLIFPWIHKYVSKQEPSVSVDTSFRSNHGGVDMEQEPPTPGAIRQISAVSEVSADEYM
jgi:hypothetical protein